MSAFKEEPLAYLGDKPLVMESINSGDYYWQLIDNTLYPTPTTHNVGSFTNFVGTLSGAYIKWCYY